MRRVSAWRLFMRGAAMRRLAATTYSRPASQPAALEMLLVVAPAVMVMTMAVMVVMKPTMMVMLEMVMMVAATVVVMAPMMVMMLHGLHQIGLSSDRCRGYLRRLRNKSGSG